MALLQDLFKELREEELYELCPNDKARHNLLRFIVSMHSPETEFSERLIRYCEVNNFVIGSGLTTKSVICLTKGKGEVIMAKGKAPANLELIGGLACMILEAAEKLAENGSVTVVFDGENLTFSEGKASKEAKDTTKKSKKKGKEEEEEEEEEEEKPKKGKGKSAKKEEEEKPKKKSKKPKFEPESLSEFDEKADPDNVEAIVAWATEQELEFEESTKPKVTIKRIREAAIEAWSEDSEDWSEDED